MGDGATRLLWTGGWDSSFRLMQLLLVERRPVQPIYVVQPYRGSLARELETMQKLRGLVRERLDDPSLFAPVEIHLASDHPPVEWQTAAWQSIEDRAPLGDQYLLLAGVGEAMGWRSVELCIQLQDDGGMSEWEELVFDEPGVLNDALEAALLKYWSFPVMHLKKEDMRNLAATHGFLDLLVQRWFCFDPLGGKPCGRCRPCERANHDGVTFANPALVRVRRMGRLTVRRIRSWRARPATTAGAGAGAG